MSKRTRKRDAPSASMYLGYVEDDESPAAIMKKFEAMEKYKHEIRDHELKTNPNTNSGEKSSKCEAPPQEETLSGDQLNEVFKRTSMFTMDSISKQDELMADRTDAEQFHWIPGVGYGWYESSEIDYGELVEECVYDYSEEEGEGGERDGQYIDVAQYDSDSDDDMNKTHEDDNEDDNSEYESDEKDGNLSDVLEFSDEETLEDPPVQRKRRGPYSRLATGGTTMDFSTGAEISIGPVGTALKKRKLEVDPLLAEYIRIPCPLNFAWAKPIIPYKQPNSEIPPGSKYIETDILGFNLRGFAGAGLQGILMNPPWRVPHEEMREGQIMPADLRKLQITSDLAPNTVILIWVEKEYILDVSRVMKEFKFNFAESMVFVKKGLNNKILCQNSPRINRSKAILMMYRKKHKHNERLELRHQRTCDVIFDFVSYDKETEEELRPRDYTYDLVETLLPTGGYNEQTGRGLLLELWAPKGTRRKGWATVVQK